MRIHSVVNTLHLISVTDSAGNLRTIEADGHAEEHLTDTACIIRPFGDAIIYRDEAGSIVKTVSAVADADKELWVGSPANVSGVWNPPPASNWLQSATIVIVSMDALGTEIDRTPPRSILAVP